MMEIKNRQCMDCGKSISRRAKRCKKCFATGKNNPSWKGGKPKCIVCQTTLINYGRKYCDKCSRQKRYKESLGNIIYRKGYAYVKVARSKGSTRPKYIKRCRLVLEKHLNRKLKITENVHHINGNKLDDRLENLLMCSNSIHKTIHELAFKYIIENNMLDKYDEWFNNNIE